MITCVIRHFSHPNMNKIISYEGGEENRRGKKNEVTCREFCKDKKSRH